MTVQLYVNNTVLDLFNDEKISVKSSVQDIADIGKVFTDFSQGFTVPATDKNNQVFAHYYNNDLNLINANIRIPAYIEIDRDLFRKGKVQLEGAIIKDGLVEGYNLTFFGDVVTLKDRFGDDKLKDLDYSSVTFEYNYTNVKDSLSTTAYQDVRFPLITSGRRWEYGQNEDISTGATAINYGELFPALSDSKIMQIIASKYGVTFEGTFLSDERLKNSYTWFKNSDVATMTTTGEKVLINTANNPNTVLPVVINPVTSSVTNIITFPRMGEDKIHLQKIGTSSFTYTNTPVSYTAQHHKIKLYFYSLSNSSTAYFVDVYRNGQLATTRSVAGGSTSMTIINTDLTSSSETTDYSFRVRTAGTTLTMSTTATLEVTQTYQYITGYVLGEPRFATDTATLTESYNGGLTTSSSMDLNFLAPDQTVAEWFTGTLKQFNLTCYATFDDDTFEVETLDGWYAAADTVDLTEYVRVESMKVNRPKLHNEISFKWQPSQSFINLKFKEDLNRDYGHLIDTFPEYDGGKYEILLPFETLQFSNLTGVVDGLAVGYCLTKEPDYKPYIPKPVKLYHNPVAKTTSFYFTDGATPVEITSYTPFEQTTTYNNNTYTINWGEELGIVSLQDETNSLYKTYYSTYLNNLYNTKTRVVTVDAELPSTVLNSLNLNDTIIIRDKAYRINDFTADITTGAAKLVLITAPANVNAERSTSFTGDESPTGGGTVKVPIKVIRRKKRRGKVRIKEGGEFNTATSPTLPYDVVTNEDVEFVIPVNNTGGQVQNTFIIETYDTGGNLLGSRPITITQPASDSYLLTEGYGFLLTENLDKIFL